MSLAPTCLVCRMVSHWTADIATDTTAATRTVRRSVITSAAMAAGRATCNQRCQNITLTPLHGDPCADTA